MNLTKLHVFRSTISLNFIDLHKKELKIKKAEWHLNDTAFI